MKRSEAIELILSKMKHLDLGKDDGITAISEFTEVEYSDASQLLEFIEDIGMLPPATDYFVKNQPEGFYQVWDTASDYHKWEPEE